MLHAGGNHHQFPWSQRYDLVPKFHPEHPAPNQEKLILGFMPVPGEYPRTLMSLTSCPFNRAIVFGRQCSENNPNFSTRLIAVISV